MTDSIRIITREEFLKNNKKPNQREVWNNIAKSVEKRDFFKIRKIPLIEEFLKDKKGRIIDLGCGAGWNMIKNNNIEYYGIDFSKESLNLAEKYTKNNKIKAKLFKSDISKLNKSIFKNEIFDYGLFIASLHCLETKKQRENALKGFYRVLKKGAEAIITAWNSEDRRFSGLKRDIYMSWKNNNKFYMRYYYLYEKQEFIDLLENIGFKIIEFYKEKEHDRFSRKNWIVRVGKN